MEFLTTPDFSSNARWFSATPNHSDAIASDNFLPGLTPATANHFSASSSALPANSAQTSTAMLASTPYYTPAYLDRAGIKSSFQSLFSPSATPNPTPQPSLTHAQPHSMTPALMSRSPQINAPNSSSNNPSTSIPGLTPFLASFNTPSLVPPHTSLLSSFPQSLSNPSLHDSSSVPQSASKTNEQNPTTLLTSPFLQAAAKEAVRREFLNMPSYVAPPSSSAPPSTSAPASSAPESSEPAPNDSSKTHSVPTGPSKPLQSPSSPPKNTFQPSLEAATTSASAPAVRESNPSRTIPYVTSSKSDSAPTSTITPSPQSSHSDGHLPPPVKSSGKPASSAPNISTVTFPGSSSVFADDAKDDSEAGNALKPARSTASMSAVTSSAARTGSSVLPSSSAMTGVAPAAPNSNVAPAAPAMHNIPAVQAPGMAPSQLPTAPYFMAHPHPHGGMMFVGPHGHVMMAAPHGAAHHPLYHPANPYSMMMFGAQHPMMQAQQAQFMMHNQAAAAAAAAASAVAASSNHTSTIPQHQAVAASAQTQPQDQVVNQSQPSQTIAQSQSSLGASLSAQPGSSGSGADISGSLDTAEEFGDVASGGRDIKMESSDEKKSRVELEKQELIREFKKKTREAALVRFRQKRSERRFGKLIRYDCRKKLADARPRVKGRFVRIKADELGEDESECAQVVPDYLE